MPTAEIVTHDPDTATTKRFPGEFTERFTARLTDWHRGVIVGLIAYVVTRLCVLAGAGVRASQKAVDARKLAELAGVPAEEPTAIHTITEVLTSWDGRWYLELVRGGYPDSIPANITYEQLEARAAFFPVYPTLARWLDWVLPGGDTLAAILLNVVLGAVSVVLVGLLARELYGVTVASRAMVLYVVFPGSFVLSFTYSEATLIVLAAACLLFLVREQWWLAGIAAMIGTGTRPNGVGLVAACVVASFIAIRRSRDWTSLVAVVLSPLGFIAFQLYIDHTAGERGAWFRVQSEAWKEGTSFGATAVTNTLDFITHPFSSPTDALTALSMAALVAMIYCAWRVRLSWPLAAYSAVVVALDADPRDRHRTAAVPHHRIPAADRSRRVVDASRRGRCRTSGGRRHDRRPPHVEPHRLGHGDGGRWRRNRHPHRPVRGVRGDSVMRTLIVVPTHNEADNIASLLTSIRETVPDADTIVIDDASTDATRLLVRTAMATDDRLRLVERDEKRGLGDAYLHAFEIALAEGYDAVVEIDADHSHDPAVLPTMLDVAGRGIALVIGSRYVPGGTVTGWPRRRTWLSRWGNRYVAIMLGLAINDATAGYRVYRTDALRTIGLGGVQASGYVFQVELTYRVVRSGLSVVEIPISFTDRVAGSSKMNRSIIFESFRLVTLWGLQDMVSLKRRQRAYRTSG